MATSSPWIILRSISGGRNLRFYRHNGAGKTTTLKAVPESSNIDEVRFSSRVYVKKQPIECKTRMAYNPDNPDLYLFMSGIKYLEFYCRRLSVGAEERRSELKKYADLFELTRDRRSRSPPTRTV
jgi:ABC-2 type transport system ATP-binding protein